MSNFGSDNFSRLPITLPPLEGLAGTLGFEQAKVSTRLATLMQDALPGNFTWNLRMAQVLFQRGDQEMAERYALTASELAENEDQVTDALRVLVGVHLVTGASERARTLVGRLRGIADPARRNRAYGNWAESQAILHLLTGDLASGVWFESESRYRLAMRIWESHGDTEGRFRIFDQLGRALAAVGNYAGTVELCDQGIALALELNAWHTLPSLLLNRAYAVRDFGMHEAALVGFLDALQWAGALEDGPILARGWCGYMVLLGYFVTKDDLSELPAFEQAREVALRHSTACHFPPCTAEIYLRSADLYEKIGMMDRASEDLQHAIAVTSESEGETTQTFFVGQEIQRRALEQSRQERLRLRMREVIESTPDALLVLDAVRDADGRIVDFINEFRNSTGDRICGCTSTDVLTLGQLSDVPAFEGLAEEIRRVIDTSIPYIDEIRPFRSESWIARRVVTVGDGVAVTLRDVSIEHAAAEALREAAQSARDADRAKSVFLANMSHEIRTPINGVLGLARLLADTHLDEEQREYLQGIIASTDILLGVLGGVLDLSKIESGRMDLQVETVQLHKLVREVMSLFSGQAAEKGLALVSEVHPATPATVEADGTRLRQVLANLLGNAIKFTDEGFIRVEVRPVGLRLRFEVIDSGKGVAQNQLDSIFEAFRQGGADSVASGGTGLGLTISRKLVELMHGTLGIVSRPGSGSRFWFELPIASLEVTDAAVQVAPPDIAGVRVLLVEDNPVNTLVATGLLTNAGCLVNSVPDGASAVAAAERGDYDIVLMDIRMPGMDGLEATRQIRKMESSTLRRIPIIALTASAFTDDRDVCYQAGMDDYLGKPFTAEALRATVSRWAPRKA